MYGLESSPADWAVYRDRAMRAMEWSQADQKYRLRQSPEGNVWGIVKILENEQTGETAEETVGHLVVYVDDVMGDWRLSGSAVQQNGSMTRLGPSFAALNSCGLLMVNPCGWDSPLM